MTSATIASFVSVLTSIPGKKSSPSRSEFEIKSSGCSKIDGSVLVKRHSRSAAALADWLAAHGHADAALVVYRRFIRDHGRAPGAAEAQLGAGLVELGRGQLAPAYQHLRASLDRDPAPETRVRATEALQPIAGQQKYAMPRFEGRMG